MSNHKKTLKIEENGADVLSVPFFVVPLRPKLNLIFKEDEVEKYIALCKKLSTRRNFVAHY